METILLKTKCDDFEVESENSDAECFQNSWINSKREVIKNPKLCDICVYNKKHKHHTYQSWIDYRNEIGIPSKCYLCDGKNI
jgi:hypothetical protein